MRMTDSTQLINNLSILSSCGSQNLAFLYVTKAVERRVSMVLCDAL